MSQMMGHLYESDDGSSDWYAGYREFYLGYPFYILITMDIYYMLSVIYRLTNIWATVAVSLSILKSKHV